VSFKGAEMRLINTFPKLRQQNIQLDLSQPQSCILETIHQNCEKFDADIIVASEQGLGRRLSQDKIDQMKKEIMQVVSRYVSGVGEQHIQMQVRSEANIEMLEMNINLPEER